MNDGTGHAFQAPANRVLVHGAVSRAPSTLAASAGARRCERVGLVSLEAEHWTAAGGGAGGARANMAALRDARGMDALLDEDPPDRFGGDGSSGVVNGEQPRRCRRRGRKWLHCWPCGRDDRVKEGCSRSGGHTGRSVVPTGLVAARGATRDTSMSNGDHARHARPLTRGPAPVESTVLR